MNDTQIKEGLDFEILQKMQTDKPLATYIKTIVGKLGVVVYNPVYNRIEDVILVGDPNDPHTDLDNITVKLWTESSLMWFKKANKNVIENGMLVPYNKEEKPEFNLSNAITDEEIEEILSKPFFALDNKLKEFTSPIPVERTLRKAIEMNRPIGTINKIKERLSELQELEGLDNKRLEEHYKNLRA